MRSFSLVWHWLTQLHLEGKKHIKSKKVNFLFLFFVFQVSKLNWRYKIKKERKRWAEKKNYTQIFDTTRWRTSQ